MQAKPDVAVLLAAPFALILFAAPRAFAQQRFGRTGVAITAEDLFELSSESTTVHDADGDHTDRNSRVGLFYDSRFVPSVMAPRFGVHVFVVPQLSIGATLGYEHRGGSTTEPKGPANAPVTSDKGGGSAFVFLPKVGYALPFSDVVGLWPRLGLGWVKNTDYPNPNNTVEQTTTSFGVLSIDALVVVTPIPSFGFYAGPTLDLSFSGSREEVDEKGVSTSRDASFHRFDFGVGLLGYFGMP